MMSFIISYFRGLGIRGIINWILLILLIVVAVKRCSENADYRRTIKKLSEVKPNPETEIVKEAERISDRVDEEGREIVIWKESEPIIKKIEDSVKADSLAKIADVRLDRIKSIESVNASLNAENKKLKEVIRENETGSKDTVYEYKDKWLVNTVYKRDTGLFSDVWVDASVNKIEHDKRKFWFFGKNESLTTIWYSSPYIRQSGYETLKIKQKEDVFDFGIELEGRYMFDSDNLLIGPKGNIRIGRFNINGGYMLNPRGSIGSGPWIGGGYKVY